MKYEGKRCVRVGILIFLDSSNETPKCAILGTHLENRGIKNKWRKPNKIKDWLLYNQHSYTLATSHTLAKGVFGEVPTITELGEKLEMEKSEVELLENMFPRSMGKRK